MTDDKTKEVAEGLKLDRYSIITTNGDIAGMGAGFVVPKDFQVNGIVRFLNSILPEGEHVYMSEIGEYKLGGSDADTKGKIMVGTRYSVDELYKIIEESRPAAKGEMAHPVEIGKSDDGVWISKAFTTLVGDSGRYQLIDAEELTREFTIYVAGQPEEKFAAGEQMPGTLQRYLGTVQMGSIRVAKEEKKKFMECRPAIIPIIFTMPVKDGVIFFEQLDVAIKEQIILNDKRARRGSS